MKSLWLIAPLILILAVTIAWAAGSWLSIGGDMPPSGYIALALGVGFSLVIGIGLMALVFISSRRGYDEAAHGDRRDPPEARS